MYGYNPEDPKMHVLNCNYILLGKRHTFLQRSEFKPPSFDHFLEFASKAKLIAQRSILYSKGQKIISFTMEASPLLTLNDFIGLGCEIGKGNRAGYGISILA